MSYTLTPVPQSLGTPDGFLAKTDKAKLMHILVDPVSDAEVPGATSETLYIEDGNALLHALNKLPPTFKETTFKVVDQLQSKPNVVFSTDSYFESSIKSQERKRRGTSQKIIVNVNTKMPADFPGFLKNPENKTQLFKVMLEVLSSQESANKLKDKNFIIIVEGKAVKVMSDGSNVNAEEIESLYSTQEETDTRVVLYILYARSKDYKHVVVRSPDTDILLILLYYARKFNPLVVYFDTGKGAKRRVINVTDLAEDQGEHWCEAFLGFHCFTGEDTNSAFKGKGKLTPLKKLRQKPKFLETFKSLGHSLEVSDQTKKELEEFTCFLYGHKKEKSVDAARLLMLKKATGGNTDSLRHVQKVDLSRLPPCRRSLIPHVLRSNLRCYEFKHSHLPDPQLPAPGAKYGWTTDDDGNLEPLWSDGTVLPESLHELVVRDPNEESDEDDIDSDRESCVDYSSGCDSDF